MASTAPTKALIQYKIEQAIALSLHSWDALSIAVQNEWGGPDSSEKRDWFAGQISELFDVTPPEAMDAEYLEEMILQVMNDEYDCVVEDGSSEVLSERIFKLRAMCLEGDFRAVDELAERWSAKQSRGEKVNVTAGKDESEDDSESEDDEEGDTAMEGVEYDDTPQLVRKPEPEVDEDGFTKVVGKKRR